jgi:hypothetical protein
MDETMLRLETYIIGNMIPVVYGRVANNEHRNQASFLILTFEDLSFVHNCEHWKIVISRANGQVIDCSHAHNALCGRQFKCNIALFNMLARLDSRRRCFRRSPFRQS